MKVCSIVGARPQFVKLAAIDSELRRRNIEHVVINTGQHYDKDMSANFFLDLGISAPNVDLGVGSGSHGYQTGKMLIGLEKALIEHRPNWTLVYGDTNSTVAGALAATKLGLPVAHLEAGLRSFNRKMPEELNRVATDHLSDLLLAPTQVAFDHLAREGLAERATVVGDVMTDILYRERDAVRELSTDPSKYMNHEADDYWFATIHRPYNTDDKKTLSSILSAFEALPDRVLLAVHPRLRASASAHGLNLASANVQLLPPLAYRELISTVMGSKGVITDSGGLQKEAFLLRRPCITVRSETEWVETIELGWNQLCPDPLYLNEAASSPPPTPTKAAPYGTGDAASRAVDILERNL